MNNEYQSSPDSTSASTAKLVCPLLTAGLNAGVGKSRTLPCLGAECAWWDKAAGACVVLSGRAT